MPQYSFDITSEINTSELDHAIDQSRREITNRYDFKGSSASVSYTDDKRESLTIEGDNEYQIEAVLDMLRGKIAKRGLSQKILDTSNEAQQSGMTMKKVVPFQQGLSQDKSKQITKLLREKHPKIKTQIQGEEIRVTGSSKDELQTVMSLLTEQNFSFPIAFGNYR